MEIEIDTHVTSYICIVPCSNKFPIAAGKSFLASGCVEYC